MMEQINTDYADYEEKQRAFDRVHADIDKVVETVVNKIEELSDLKYILSLIYEDIAESKVESASDNSDMKSEFDYDETTVVNMAAAADTGPVEYIDAEDCSPVYPAEDDESNLVDDEYAYLFSM